MNLRRSLTPVLAAAGLAAGGLTIGGCASGFSDCQLRKVDYWETAGYNHATIHWECKTRPEYLHFTIKMQTHDPANTTKWTTTDLKIVAKIPPVGEPQEIHLKGMCVVESRVRLFAAGRGVSSTGKPNKLHTYWPNIVGRPTGLCL